MTLDFYTTSDDFRKIGKEKKEKKSVEAVYAYETVSVLSPSFILAYDAALLSKNVFWCGDFGRWYTVTSMVAGSAGQLVVTGHVDVLDTYADAILACRAQAVRSSSAGYTLVPDTAFPIDPVREYVTSKLLGASDLDTVPGADPYRYVLTLK